MGQKFREELSWRGGGWGASVWRVTAPIRLVPYPPAGGFPDRFRGAWIGSWIGNVPSLEANMARMVKRGATNKPYSIRLFSNSRSKPASLVESLTRKRS